MKRLIVAAAILLISGGPQLVAHHPFAAEYDWKRPVTVKGTVTKFDWKNPHTLLEIKGTDEKGAQGEWSVELGGPGQLQRLGWNAKQFKSGDPITVDGWMAKDGSKRLSAKSVIAPGGRELAAASSFFENANQNARAGTSRSDTAGTSGKEQTLPVR
jgi:hypothetical protein